MSEQAAADIAANPALTNLLLVALFVQFTRLLPLLRSALLNGRKLDVLLKHFGLRVDDTPATPAAAPSSAVKP